MVARWLRPLFVTLLASLIAMSLALPARAAPLAQATDTETPTPTVTATPTITPTPGYQVVATLTSGNQLLIERRWSFGDLATFLAVLGLIALEALRWMYDLTHVQEVVITRKEVE